MKGKRMTARARGNASFAHRHGLGVAVAGVLCLWLLLYARSDPQTHLGAFFGNATADWLGTLIIVIATKSFTRSVLARAAARIRPHETGWYTC